MKLLIGQIKYFTDSNQGHSLKGDVMITCWLQKLSVPAPPSVPSAAGSCPLASSRRSPSSFSSVHTTKSIISHHTQLILILIIIIPPTTCEERK